MKFLAKAVDGSVIGRLPDDRLVFPIPSDVIVYDSLEDISEGSLAPGSTAVQFYAAKVAAFRASHPTFDSIPYGDEFLDGTGCDLSFSQYVTNGSVAKTTSVRPGGTFTTVQYVTPGAYTHFCMRYRTFILGSKTGEPNSRYYNFDEATQEFVDPPDDDMTVSINFGTYIIRSDEEVTMGPPIVNFRISFANSGSRTVYLSDWTLLFNSV